MYSTQLSISDEMVQVLKIGGEKVIIYTVIFISEAKKCIVPDQPETQPDECVNRSDRRQSHNNLLQSIRGPKNKSPRGHK